MGIGARVFALIKLDRGLPLTVGSTSSRRLGRSAWLRELANAASPDTIYKGGAMTKPAMP
jgi:hypothetical protein